MKLTKFAMAALVAFSLSTPLQAAEEWGIDHEKVSRIEVKVVDVLCELTGDCPANCGGGKRQLGLLTAQGRLLLAVKNNDIFAGAAHDLAPFCGKQIIADGLLIENPKLPMFQLQFKRLAPDGKWSRATGFTKDWAKRNPGKDAAQWYKHDPLVKQTLAADGVFGIPGLKPKDD